MSADYQYLSTDPGASYYKCLLAWMYRNLAFIGITIRSYEITYIKNGTGESYRR